MQLKPNGILKTGASIGILLLLIDWQVHSYRSFDWSRFWASTHISVMPVVIAIGLVYLTYVLRALRWKMFLQSICKTRTTRLISPMVIGFSSVALLGRAGELVRPYLVSRREKISLSSQIGILAIERIFDIGALAILIAGSVFLSSDLRLNPYVRNFKLTSVVLCVCVVLVAGIAAIAYKRADSLSGFVGRILGRFSSKWAHLARDKVRDFAQGLNSVSTSKCLWQLTMVSLATWLIVAMSYHEIAHAYVKDNRQDASPDSPVSLDVATAKLAGFPALAGQELTPRLMALLAPPLEEKGYTIMVKQNEVWRIQKTTSTAFPIGTHPSLNALSLAQMMLLLGVGMLGSIVQLPAVGGGTQIAISSGVEILYGIPPEAALSFAILVWLVTYTSCIPLGIVLAHRERLSIRASVKESC